jgi:hypothetical protein
VIAENDVLSRACSRERRRCNAGARWQENEEGGHEQRCEWFKAAVKGGQKGRFALLKLPFTKGEGGKRKEH